MPCFALWRFAICGVPINCALPVARRRPCIGPDAPRHCSAVGRGRRPGATGRPVRRDGSEPLGSLAAAGLQLTTGAYVCYLRLGRPGLPVAPSHMHRGAWACQRLRAIAVHGPASGAGPSPAPSCAVVARCIGACTGRRRATGSARLISTPRIAKRNKAKHTNVVQSPAKPCKALQSPAKQSSSEHCKA